MNKKLLFIDNLLIHQLVNINHKLISLREDSEGLRFLIITGFGNIILKDSVIEI